VSQKEISSFNAQTPGHSTGVTQKETGCVVLNKTLAVLVLLVFSILVLFERADAQLLISGDFDARGEYLNLRRIVSDSLNSKSFNFSGSAEFDFGYRYKHFDSYLALLTSYSSGTNLFSYANPGTFSGNAYQAWVSYQFSKWFSLQAGRIELSYDDQRFFQARDWNHLVTSHNAVIAHWLAPDTNFMADLGVAANKFPGFASNLNTEPTVNGYRYLGFLYAHKKTCDDKLLFTLTDICDASDNGVSRSVLYGRNTLGLSTWLAWTDWNLFLTGFYQAGHITDGRRLSAFYYSGYFGYQFTGWLGVMLAYEHMSGDNYADSAEWKKVVHGFSMLYGNSRKNMGLSGFFNAAYRTNINPGLNNLYLTTTFTVSDAISIEASYHWFSLPHAYMRELDPVSGKYVVEKISSSLIHEADLLFTFTPVESLEIDLNYSLLFPGRSLSAFNGWNTNGNNMFSYAYLEVDFSPTLLGPKTKIKHLH